MFKTPHPFTALLVSLFITGTSSGGVWTQKANVPGLGRADGTGAATTGKGYIEIIDSQTTSCGLGMIVQSAAEFYFRQGANPYRNH